MTYPQAIMVGIAFAGQAPRQYVCRFDPARASAPTPSLCWIVPARARDRPQRPIRWILSTQDYTANSSQCGYLRESVGLWTHPSSTIVTGPGQELRRLTAPARTRARPREEGRCPPDGRPYICIPSRVNGCRS